MAGTWYWIQRKLSKDIAQSTYAPSAIYSRGTVKVSSVTRGNTPMSTDGLTPPFTKTWELQNKVSFTLTVASNGAYTADVYDIQNQTNIGTKSGTNLQSNASIDLLLGINDTELGVFPVFLMTQSNNTSNFVVISLLGETNRSRLYTIMGDIPTEAPSPNAGAGSGYIGYPLLDNKKMVGYNVPTSSAVNTKTESVSEASENPVADKPKIGNGFARIKFLRDHADLPIIYKNAVVLPNDTYTVKGKGTETIYTIAELKQTFATAYGGNNTFYLVWDTNGYVALPFNESSGFAMKLGSGAYVENDGQTDWLYGFNGAAQTLYPCYLNGSLVGVAWSISYKVVENTNYYNFCYSVGSEEHPCVIVCMIDGFDIYKDNVKVARKT